MVKLYLRLGYNTHPPRESHYIEKAKNGQILKIKRPNSEIQLAFGLILAHSENKAAKF